jgi:hypothetical protein
MTILSIGLQALPACGENYTLSLILE